ncbi:hypothetical protein JCM10450v2_004929 [Rhodotorula kratochvilovae]
MPSTTSILATAAAVAGLATQVAGHMSIWHPSMYGVGPNWEYTAGPPTDPIGPYFYFDDWWFRGPAYRNLPPVNGDVMNLPAGGSITLEIACHYAWTSYGYATTEPGSELDACPGDNAGPYHSGDPNSKEIDYNLLSGCALGIADVDNINDVTMDNLAIFSVQHDCVKQKLTSFEIPAKMPACTGEKCICAWFWLANNGTGNYYQTAFDCSVSNSPADATPIAPPQDPVFCKNNPSSCTTGSKRPIYAYNFPSNVPWISNYDRAGYHASWSFGTNGAQNDIFMPAGYDKTAYAASMNKTITIEPTWPTPTGADGAEDLAMSARASASTTSFGQGAYSAIDGVVGGYVEDGSGYSSLEWSSDHEGVGAWLNLAWSSPITFNQIQLFDRPNLDDQITSGNITFSDGSSIAFGALPNDATTPLYLNFATPITASSLRLTVTGASASTSNIGLSEIEIYSVSSAGFTSTVSVVNAPVASSASSAIPSSTAVSSTAVSSSAVPSSTEVSSSVVSSTAIESSALPTSTVVSTSDVASSAVSSAAASSTVVSTSDVASSSVVSSAASSSAAASSEVVPSSQLFLDRDDLLGGDHLGCAGYVVHHLGCAYHVELVGRAVLVEQQPVCGCLVLVQLVCCSYDDLAVDHDDAGADDDFPHDDYHDHDDYPSSHDDDHHQDDDDYDTNSPYSAAIDGHIGGVVNKRGTTGNAGYEWSSKAQRDGAWLTLKWASSVTFNQVVLYDRPNLQDQILAGNITFSDGSRVDVGQLNNDGTATTLNLGKTVTATSLTFYVSKVSSTTTNAGLSEIQLFLADASKFTSVVVPTAVPSPTPSSTTSTKTTTTSKATSTTTKQIWYLAEPTTKTTTKVTTTTAKPTTTTKVVRLPWAEVTSLARAILANPKFNNGKRDEVVPTAPPAPRHMRDFRRA